MGLIGIDFDWGESQFLTKQWQIGAVGYVYHRSRGGYLRYSHLRTHIHLIACIGCRGEGAIPEGVAKMDIASTRSRRNAMLV